MSPIILNQVVILIKDNTPCQGLILAAQGLEPQSPDTLARRSPIKLYRP
jgi:hypothetical protein